MRAERTRAAKVRMLKALIDPTVFTVMAAARLADIAPKTHYAWIKEDKEYEQLAQEAYEIQTQNLEQKAGERAAGIGVKTPSDYLMTFLLQSRRPEAYRSIAKGELKGKGGESVTFTLHLGDGAVS